MRARLFLLFPVLIFALAFAIDKLPFALGLQDYFLQTLSFLNYDHKERLKDQLAEYLRQPDRRKVLVVFGNSRTMPFNNEQVERENPGWILFNFSVPGGTSDYFLRYMEEFEAEGVRPDIIYFAVTPQAFNARAASSMDEVMLNGLTPGFVIRHAARYSLDDLSNYAAKEIFWTYQYRLGLRVINHRQRNNGAALKHFREFRDFTMTSLERERGSVFIGAGGRGKFDQDAMQKQAADIWRGFFQPEYRLSEGQMFFTEECLRIARRLGVPARLIWPRVSPELRRLLDAPLATANAIAAGAASDIAGSGRSGKGVQVIEEPDVREIWATAIDEVARRYDGPLIDTNFQTDFSCDRHYDASHMSSDCFGELGRLMIGLAPK